MATVPTTPVHVTVAGRLGDYGYHMAHTLAGVRTGPNGRLCAPSPRPHAAPRRRI